MPSDVPAPPAAEVPPAQSVAERFLDIFISPREAFADIVRRPDFVAPLIVVILSTVAVTETMLAKIGMDRIIRMSIEHSSRGASMSPEQIQQAVDRGALFGAIIAHVSGLLGAPIFLLIVAGIGMAVVNGIFGGQMNFKSSFSVACYANLVGVLGAVMAVAMILFGDPEHFNPQSPTPSNLGFFLNPLETPKPLMAIAGSFDIFTLWLMAVLGIGFSEAAGKKVKALAVFFTLFAIWMVWVLGKAGVSMLTG